MCRKICPSQYNRLLHYLGCGNFPNVDILVFGNEEGLGGLPIRENIEARAWLFGKVDGEYRHCLSGSNWKSGYYEPSAGSGRDKILTCMGINGTAVQAGHQSFNQGQFLSSIARICLALEDPRDDKSYWFRPLNDDLDAKARINDCVVRRLFGDDPTRGVQTALTDWRPLPRENQKKKYDDHEIYRDVIRGEVFSKAFALTTKPNALKDQYTDYREDAGVRVELLRGMLNTFTIPIILGLGETQLKVKALKRAFPEAVFEPLELRDSITSKCLKSSLSGGCGETQVFLIPHPGSLHLAKGELFTILRELTNDYLRPIYERHRSRIRIPGPQRG